MTAAPRPVSPSEFAALPAGTISENLRLTVEDGAASYGVLYTMGGERTVVCLTHPRGDYSRHYTVPMLLDAGYAVCGFTQRAGLDDIALVHERMLLDIAGALRLLRSERGYGQALLLASSGSGGISGYYQWQAATPPPGRFTSTPAGDPLDLNGFDLPQADGLILLGTPFGESEVIARGIDPSVVDEDDPLSCDPALDMYDARNGYREPPEASSYREEFVARYRAAQLARIVRIDAVAHARIAEQRRWQARLAEPDFASLPPAERLQAQRRAFDTQELRVYRTDASLAFCDLSLYPSKRKVGSFLSAATHAMNYMSGRVAQRRSPRAWLSASSINSSRSNLRLSLPHVRVPTLILGYTADRGVYPDDLAAMLALSAAEDKALHHIDAEHLCLAVEGLGDPAPRETEARLVTQWLRERFPGRQLRDSAKP